MILLLDAHVVIWALTADHELQSSTLDAIASPANDVLVSAATVWEIEVKRAAGRLQAPDGLLEALDAVGIATIPVTAADAIEAARLELAHTDPFDRMLVAQAKRLGAVIVSRDRALIASGVVEILPA